LSLWALVAQAVAYGFGIAIGVLVALAYLMKIARQLAPAFANDRSLPRLAYRAALDVLGEGGIRREEGESRELFAYRVRSSVPSLQPLTDAHAAVAYQSRRAPKTDAVRNALRRIRAERARTVPLWRRLLGIADPFSWLFTR
jgi:hypothetical protein